MRPFRICRVCKKLFTKKGNYQLDCSLKCHKKYRVEYTKKWRRNHEDYSKKYYEQHKKHIIESVKKRRRKRPEIINAWQKKYRKDHREKINQRSKIYKKIYDQPECFPLDNKCIFCGDATRLEHGHLDYEDNGENYVTVCRTCNYWMER